MDREELVQLAGEKLASAIFRSAPGDDPALQVEGFGVPEADQVRVFVYGDVLDELLYAADWQKKPAAAILLGAFAVDDTGPFMEITGFSDFQQIDAIDELFEALRSPLDELLKDLSARRELQEHVVGFFVSAPGSGGELPEEVARVHLSLFNIPYQVAAVADVDAGQFGMHARPPAASFYNAPFWLVRDAAEGSNSTN